ncbi:MAG: MBL fold metallo-hydrolase [Chloroflexi bacterium]|nr:MAG: MBL fold metallo-hydrolase [Chloroflexota bacterium]
MKILWLGHSCFLLTSEDGVRVLTDPFNPIIGFPAPAVEADYVTVSHQHDDHNYTKVVKGDFAVIDKPGVIHGQGVEIEGFATFHDEVKGAKRGTNVVFRITLDGLQVVHCGDLGHPLSAEQAQAIGPADVLLLPVGGHYTIDSEAACQVAQALQPALIVPMHFKTGALDIPITTVDPFLQAMHSGKRAGAQEIVVTRESLETRPGVVVLDAPAA